MTINRARRWRIIRSFGLGWIAAFLFLSIVRGSGTIEQGSVQFQLLPSLIMSVLLGSIFGGLAGAAQVWIEERVYRRIPLMRLLAWRLAFATASLVAMVLLSYAIVTSFFGVTIGLVEFFVEPGSFAIYFYILTVDLLIVFLRHINLLLGDGKLWQLFRGRFYTPREDERVFMFLDLEASTGHAEELGHIAYSRMIQDCFDDLGVVADHGAEIYQYLGDGAVLTWAMPDGLRSRNCIKAFERFRERLDARGPHYLSTYRRQPHFTAGVHAGKVVVTEVGRHKKEIAYHGDTINTAARIQGQCREMGYPLLISRPLAEALGVSPTARDLGEINLRGKEASIGLVALDSGVTP